MGAKVASPAGVEAQALEVRPVQGAALVRAGAGRAASPAGAEAPERVVRRLRVVVRDRAALALGSVIPRLEGKRVRVAALVQAAREQADQAGRPGLGREAR